MCLCEFYDWMMSVTSFGVLSKMMSVLLELQLIYIFNEDVYFINTIQFASD